MQKLSLGRHGEKVFFPSVLLGKFREAKLKAYFDPERSLFGLT